MHLTPDPHGGRPSGAPKTLLPAVPPFPTPPLRSPTGARQSLAPAASGGAPVEEPVLDLALLWHVLSFPFRAVRRHRRVAAAAFLLVMGCVATLAVITPRQYDVDTAILAQKNFIMPALGNPRRSVPSESDAPTRQAQEAVLNRANLESLIDEAGLEAAWPLLRSPAGRIKEKIVGRIRRPMTRAERREALVNYLLSALWVVSGDGVVRIGVHFPDAGLAYKLVSLSQRNFLTARQNSEQSLIRESMQILETHLAESRLRVDSAMAELRQRAPRGSRAARNLAGLVPPSRASGGALRNPRTVALLDELTRTRAALASAEQLRAERRSTLQTRLADLRNTYGPAHPDVIATEQALRQMQAEAPELTRLRAQERQLTVQVGPEAAAGIVPENSAGEAAALTRAAIERLSTPADTLEDPNLSYAKSRLKVAIADQEDMLDRLEAARIELETARAAFKYRYTVVNPPVWPSRPSKPNLPLLAVGGVVLASMLALFCAVVADLASGRLIEGWQVSRFVGLPVLGEVPRT